MGWAFTHTVSFLLSTNLFPLGIIPLFTQHGVDIPKNHSNLLVITVFYMLRELLIRLSFMQYGWKFSKPGFSNMWTENFQMFKLVVEKAEEPEIKLPTSAGSSKKQESSRKTSISALLTMPKPLTAWITRNCRKFWKRWEYQTTWPASWETYMKVKKQQLELDMEQQTGSK